MRRIDIIGAEIAGAADKGLVAQYQSESHLGVQDPLPPSDNRWWCIGHMIRATERGPVLTLLSRDDDRKLPAWMRGRTDRQKLNMLSAPVFNRCRAPSTAPVSEECVDGHLFSPHPQKSTTRELAIFDHKKVRIHRCQCGSRGSSASGKYPSQRGSKHFSANWSLSKNNDARHAVGTRRCDFLRRM